MPEIVEPAESEDTPAEPDVRTVQQHEDRYPAVRVEQDGPVQTRELPAVAGSIVARQLDAPDQLLGYDLRRKRAVIMSLDGPIWIGTTTNDVSGAVATAAGIVGVSGGVWPANMPYEHRGAWRLYAASATPGTKTRVTVVQDQWSD